MDGQRRIPQSLRLGRRLRALRPLRQPGLAVRATARLSAILFLASTIVLGLIKGGHLGETLGSSFASAEKFGYSANDIWVTGLTQHKPNDVLAAMGVRAGQSLVMFSATDAQKAIEGQSWVQSATVERRFPGQLLVSVVEREPFAVWQKGKDYTVIDRHGIAMAGISIDSLAGLPMVTGEGANLAAPELVDALNLVPEIMIRMHAAARVGKRRWNVYLDDGIKIMLPEENMVASLRLLSRMDGSMALLSKGITAIDLRDEQSLVISKSPELPSGDEGLLTGSISGVAQ